MVIVILFVSFLCALLCAVILRAYPGKQYFSKRHFWAGYFGGFAVFLPFYFIFPENTNLEMAHILVPELTAAIANLFYSVKQVKKEQNAYTSTKNTL